MCNPEGLYQKITGTLWRESLLELSTVTQTFLDEDYFMKSKTKVLSFLPLAVAVLVSRGARGLVKKT
jgi:hypothetical protein